MKFVELHLVNGKEILVNVRSVTHSYSYEEEGSHNQTVIFFFSGKEIRVSEDYETVKKLMKE